MENRMLSSKKLNNLHESVLDIAKLVDLLAVAESHKFISYQEAGTILRDVLKEAELKEVVNKEVKEAK